MRSSLRRFLKIVFSSMIFKIDIKQQNDQTNECILDERRSFCCKNDIKNMKDFKDILLHSSFCLSFNI
ncbi:CLUMA_CG014955, isoform A [Clunio marinus]|uniref:CLUMA_CG014955, isoform A n=1 Tax=Clunio marinus TaxID=568069 RepID=A0A1J1IND9_9DIPT|nr:CLUMA_CG014955, isoform A [Clunio marinus]